MMLRVIIETCLKFGTRYYILSQVVKSTGLERAAVRHKLWKLESAGFLTRVKCWETPLSNFSKGRPTKEICYRNTKKLSNYRAGQPASNNGWDKMWRAIRALRRFTRDDLVKICSQNIENVRYFTKRLRKLGYVKPTRERGRDVPWVLIKYPDTLRPKNVV